MGCAVTLATARWRVDRLALSDGKAAIHLDREAALGLLNALRTPQVFTAGSITYIGAGGETPACVFPEGKTMHVALIKGGRIDHIEVVLDGTFGETQQIENAIPAPKESE